MRFLDRLRQWTTTAPTSGAVTQRAVSSTSQETPAVTPLPSRAISGRNRSEMQWGAAPKAPERSSFSDDASYEQAFLAYQTAQMDELKRKHPHAWGEYAIFHGCDLPPEVVFTQGLAAKGGHCFDLRTHQREFMSPSLRPSERSGLRGGGDNAEVAAGMAGEGGWVYLLQPLGGSVYLDAALGEKQIQGAKAETELSFGSAQPASQIIGARRVKRFHWASERYHLGHFVPNPNVNPEIKAQVRPGLTG